MTSERKGVGHIRTGLGRVRTGLGNIRTMRSRMDRSKIKTPQGALMEMGRLSQEQKRLGEEMAHWERRIQQIRQRLGEIAEAESWLQSFLGKAETPEEPSHSSGRKKTAAAPLSSPSAVTLRY